jgi:hypothetical protein
MLSISIPTPAPTGKTSADLFDPEAMIRQSYIGWRTGRRSVVTRKPNEGIGLHVIETELSRKLSDLYKKGEYATGRASLHAHTLHSDGVLTGVELVDAAAQQGIHTISITDHDTMDAYFAPTGDMDNTSLVEYAEGQGINLISGVELSCWWRTHPVHILAYGIDPSNPHTADLCKLTAKATMSRVSMRWWPVQALTICQLVRALDGIPVLAHPRFYWVNVRRMVRELVEYGGLVGIETEYEYRTHHRRLQCPLWTPPRIATIASDGELLRTGGADSHGTDLRQYR